MADFSRTPLLLLSEFEAEKSKAISTAATKAKVRRFIVGCSELLQRECNRRFDERIETRYFDVYPSFEGGPIRGLELFVDDDLRTVTTLLNGDTDAIAAEYYLLLPRNESAKQSILLTNASNLYWNYDTDYRQAIAITGAWGYGGRWISIPSNLLTALVSNSTTTFPVTLGTGFEVGMVLKVESEYVLVTAISSNNLTVERAFNGSTAASHALGTGFSYWYASDEVKVIVERLLAWRLEQLKSPLAGQLQLGDLTLPVDIASVPKDVSAAIKSLKAPHRMGGGAV